MSTKISASTGVVTVSTDEPVPATAALAVGVTGAVVDDSNKIIITGSAAPVPNGYLYSGRNITYYYLGM